MSEILSHMYSTQVFMYSTSYCCRILNKLVISSQNIFEKYSNIKFHIIHPVGGRSRLYMRTDEQTDTTKLIVAFRNFAHAPKHLLSPCQCDVTSRFNSNKRAEVDKRAETGTSNIRKTICIIYK